MKGRKRSARGKNGIIGMCWSNDRLIVEKGKQRSKGRIRMKEREKEEEVWIIQIESKGGESEREKTQKRIRRRETVYQQRMKQERYAIERKS